MTLDLLLILAVLLAAFVPPLIYLIWVRRAEFFDREPVAPVLNVFLYGATIALGAAFVIESLITGLLAKGVDVLSQFFYGAQFTLQIELFLLLVVIGPIVEELVKASGLVVVYRRLNSIENGLVYGAAIGLGFAAMENVLYLGNALMSGLEVFIVTAVARSLSSTFLHASATAVSGYGIARHRVMRGRTAKVGWGRYVIVAIVMHGTFNLLASMGQIFSIGPIMSLIGLALAISFAVISFRFVRERITAIDRMSLPEI